MTFSSEVGGTSLKLKRILKESAKCLSPSSNLTNLAKYDVVFKRALFSIILQHYLGAVYKYNMLGGFPISESKRVLSPYCNPSVSSTRQYYTLLQCLHIQIDMGKPHSELLSNFPATEFPQHSTFSCGGYQQVALLTKAQVLMFTL